jgi:hypothetical protein
MERNFFIRPANVGWLHHFCRFARLIYLHQVGRTPVAGSAWDVTDDGDIWNGDAPGKKIALYELNSITGGQPVYD